MASYAQVENNVVVNVVVADADWVALQSGEWIEYTAENPCGIGWDVENGVCIVPPAPEPIELPEGE